MQAGSEFFDFLSQMPPMLYFCLCFSGLWLVISVAGIFYSRSRRKTQLANSSAGTTGDTTAMKFNAEPPKPQKNFDTGELPDLDVLLDLPRTPETPSSRPAKPGTYAVKLTDGETVQAVEVMVIMRDIDDGRLIVQLGDKAYSNVNSDPDTKARFMKVMKELAQVVAAKPGTPTGETSGPPSTVTPVTEDLRADLTSEPDDAPQSTEDRAPIVSKPPPPLPDGTVPGDLPKFKLDDQPLVPRRGIGLMRMSKEDKERMKKPVQEVNIAQAIEEYLQYKLRHSDDFAGRSLHVLPTPGGGVTIEVDGKFYEAVGDIPNNEVRAFIAATIQEWQERQ